MSFAQRAEVRLRINSKTNANSHTYHNHYSARTNLSDNRITATNNTTASTSTAIDLGNINNINMGSGEEEGQIDFEEEYRRYPKEGDEYEPVTVRLNSMINNNTNFIKEEVEEEEEVVRRRRSVTSHLF